MRFKSAQRSLRTVGRDSAAHVKDVNQNILDLLQPRLKIKKERKKQELSINGSRNSNRAWFIYQEKGKGNPRNVAECSVRKVVTCPHRPGAENWGGRGGGGLGRQNRRGWGKNRAYRFTDQTGFRLISKLDSLVFLSPYDIFPSKRQIIMCF